MATWSQTFDDCPIYIHAADGQWVQYRSPGLVLWDGETREILPGVTIINTGGHFEGAVALHWAGGAEGRGLLLSGDSLTVVMDRRYLSFMYSYPNLIPEHPDTIRQALKLVEPLAFQVIYGAWWGKVVTADAKAAVVRSAERYLRHIGLEL
jgi:glyoxylase-like metal-dependent hydrolase (beta-lactamase superfamily II)